MRCVGEEAHPHPHPQPQPQPHPHPHPASPTARALIDRESDCTANPRRPGPLVLGDKAASTRRPGLLVLGVERHYGGRLVEVVARGRASPQRSTPPPSTLPSAAPAPSPSSRHHQPPPRAPVRSSTSRVEL
eukprot:3074508-Rhodomonas_salina.1